MLVDFLLLEKAERARPCFCHPALSEGLVVVDPSRVSVRGKPDNVDDHEDDEHDDVDDGGLAPAAADGGEDARLARVATVAQSLLVVAPPQAVGICGRCRP